MKDFHFDAISAFENYEIEKMREWSRCGDDKSKWTPHSTIMGMPMEAIYLPFVTKSVVLW